MVIERNKDYKLHFTAYMICNIALVLLYVYGFNITIYFALLINSPVFLMTMLSLVAFGRTFVLEEEGCTVYIWKYQKKYTWGELKTKKIEGHAFPSMLRGRYSCPYLKEAIFSPYKVQKPKGMRANIYSLFHPFSCIYINFSIKDENYQHGRYYEVEEAVFMEKMELWGVALGQGDGSVC